MQNQLQKNMSKEDSPLIQFESNSQFYIELIMLQTFHYNEYSID